MFGIYAINDGIEQLKSVHKNYKEAKKFLDGK